MSTTPDRNSASLAKLRSPRTPTSPTNIATVRIEGAVASLVENHRKWVQAAEKGSLFCNAIKNIRKNVSQSNENPYPESLLTYCKNLMVMVTIMEDIAANAETVLAQIKPLGEFFSRNDTIGYTWNYPKVVNVVQKMICSYKTELLSKTFVAENIGHTLSLDQLVLFATSWKYSLEVERERELLIKMLMFEFRLPA